LLEFLTNKAFSKNNLQQIQQHKMTIIPEMTAGGLGIKQAIACNNIKGKDCS